MTDHTGSQISDRTLDALRTTAAITAVVPDVGAQIRDSEGVVIEVRWPPLAESGHPVMAACAFRRAVATATRLRRQGEQIAMRGLALDQQPVIDWGFSGEGVVLPSGILRITRGDEWCHFAAVPSNSALVASALAGVVIGIGMSLHADEEVGVTVLHIPSSAGDERTSAKAVDAMITAMAAIGVADLEVRLGGGSLAEVDASPPLRGRS